MFSKTKANNKNIIFIDIDDTLCNTREAIYKIYQETTGDLSTSICTKDKQYESFCPMWENGEVEALFFHGRELYSKAKPFPEAEKAIEALLKKGYDIRLVTLQFAESAMYKQYWVNEYFPNLADKLYFCTNIESNKDIFIGHAIIDDHWKNIETNGSKYPVLYDYYDIYEDKSYPFKFKSLREIVDCF